MEEELGIPKKHKGSLGFQSDGVSTRYYETFMAGMSDAVPDWHADAACSTFDWYLFELMDSDNHLVSDLTTAQLWSFNQRNHEVGRSICEGCPVKVQCGKAASSEDLAWTVRGGEGPTRTVSRADATRAPKCSHKVRKSPPRPKGGGYKNVDLPACEWCARQADKIVLPRLASRQGTM